MIKKSDAESVLLKALSSGGDFAEIFIEDRDELNINMKDRVVQSVSSVHLFGAGIYLLGGLQAVYAYTNDLSLPSLLHTAEQAAGLFSVRQKQGAVESPQKRMDCANPTRIKVYPSEVSHQEKITVLKFVDAVSRAAGKGIRSINLDYFDTDQRVEIFNSEGLWTGDRRITSRIRLTPTVLHDGRSFSLWRDYCHPAGFEVMQCEADLEDFASSFLKRNEIMFQAVDAPSAYVPVVIEAGGGGTFFHEACGHSLETTIVASGNSTFSGKLGQQVASEKVTLIDDGTLPGRYGSAAIDDEGYPTQRNVLIEKGILKGYLIDRMGGRKMNMAPTGSGRRQNYTYAPAARMSNTFLEAGSDDDDEMIRSMDEGLFAVGIGGGNVNSVTGEFALAVSEGYWVKNGEISVPVRGMMLTGKGIEALMRVDRVGKNLKPEFGGFCGAGSGLVCTTAFQPRIRISGMLVGGKGEKAL